MGGRIPRRGNRDFFEVVLEHNLNGKGLMKKLLLSIGLAAVAPLVLGQTSSTTTTTTTTDSGTITEFSPGSTIVLKESSGPRTYHFGKEVVYVTRSGKTIDADAVQTRIKVGIP